MSSFQVIETGVLTSSEPMLSFGCQRQNTAPCGSASTDMRPALITSIGSENTVAPRSLAFFVSASTSSTVM